MPSRQVRGVGRLSYGRPTPRPKNRVKPSFDKEAFKKRLRWGSLVVGLFLVWSYFSIKTVEVKGTRLIDAEKLRQKAEESLKNRPWTDNLVTLDPKKLVADLEAGEYKLKSVSVVRRWPKTLRLMVSERQPSLNWESGRQVYTLDIDGSIIGPADPSAKLPSVVDSTNLPVKVGDRVVPTRFIQFTTELVSLLPKKTGLQVSGLKVPDTTSELYVTTSKGFQIKFDTTRAVEGQLQDLVNVLAVLSKQNKTPVEYIDLRVENKAYYR